MRLDERDMWKSYNRIEYIAKEPNFYRMLAVIFVVMYLLRRIAGGNFMSGLIKSVIGLGVIL